MINRGNSERILEGIIKICFTFNLIRRFYIALFRKKLLVWGYEYVGESQTVDVHIQRLRKKLELENRIVFCMVLIDFKRKSKHYS